MRVFIAFAAISRQSHTIKSIYIIHDLDILCICLNYESFYSVRGHTEAKSYHFKLRTLYTVVSIRDCISSYMLRNTGVRESLRPERVFKSLVK